MESLYCVPNLIVIGSCLSNKCEWLLTLIHGNGNGFVLFKKNLNIIILIGCVAHCHVFDLFVLKKLQISIFMSSKLTKEK